MPRRLFCFAAQHTALSLSDAAKSVKHGLETEKSRLLKFGSPDQSECVPQVPTEGPVDPPRTRTP
jgi:hypothetical protein